MSGRGSTGVGKDLHLSPRELIESLEGKLETFEQERLEAHLKECPTCRQELLAVKAFLSPGTQPEPLSEREIREGWGSLQDRLKGAPEKEAWRGPLAPHRDSSSGPPRRSPAWTFAVFGCAAAIGFAAVSLRFYGELRSLSATYRTASSRWTEDRKRAEREARELRQTLADLSAHGAEASLPQLNLPIYELFPLDASRRGTSEGRTLTVPQATGRFLLILNAQDLPGPSGRSDWTLAILDRQGRTVWRGGGLRRNELGNFTVVLDRALLPPGGYRLIVSAGDHGAPAGDYALTLR